jgi:GNAT superfamily N-acetyltransferase
MPEQVYYVCTRSTFNPAPLRPTRWLDRDEDYALLGVFWSEYTSVESGFMAEARAAGYTYAAIIEDGAIVALAAAWRYADEAWELAAVLVGPDHRKLGYGRAVCSFVTSSILETGRLATCTTGIENISMQRTAESIGFHQVNYISHEKADENR